ncbi:hypothetical protein GIB67_018383 [Kingdonia uniflora]|uniref:Uncharacterized protein n=1 Tax=Kingdonia uniflora TaxID=39325 RepID=A0A7J7MJ85_9MAGN|nr:hypothetical protein GIB67_018383 [Kingdonia uniflora]
MKEKLVSLLNIHRKPNSKKDDLEMGDPNERLTVLETTVFSLTSTVGKLVEQLRLTNLAKAATSVKRRGRSKKKGVMEVDGDEDVPLEKHRRADQELKKRVLKLEFCLQEARSQTRKLQRMGERRDKALKELKDQLATQKQEGGSSSDKENFWESSGFKFVVSMSMLVLVVFAKR